MSQIQLIRRTARGHRPRLAAVRRLYRLFSQENTSEARGLRLLRNWLSAEQREDFDLKGYFYVVGCDSRTRYRIRYGTAMNVHELDEVPRALAEFSGALGKLAVSMP